MSKTYGEFMQEVLALPDKPAADTWLEKEIEEWMASGEIQARPPEERNREWCRRQILENIGYGAGYYGDKEARKVHDLFGAVHPVFGSHTYHRDVTPKQAFDKGVEMANKK